MNIVNIVRAMQDFRNTPIVDEDFVSKRDRIDKILNDIAMEDIEFLSLVMDEIQRAKLKHPESPSLHHAMSVVTEEFLEVRSEAYAQKVNKVNLMKELIHLAASAYRMSQHLSMVDYYKHKDDR